MNSLVSVIIPTYNREATIKRAIDSVLNQTYSSLELIVVDDGSTDKTVELVDSYQDKRIRLVCLAKHSGANVARNKGISVAKGKYIAFQDSDDEWMQDKLYQQITYLEKEDKDVCYCPYVLHEDGRIKIIPEYAGNKQLHEEKIKEILQRKNVISTQTLIIRRNVIEKVGGFDETLPRLQDYEFAIRLAQCCKVGYISQPLVNVYRVNACISTNREALMEAYRKIIVKHMSFLDLEYILYSYFLNSRMFEKREIDWKDMNELLYALKTNGLKNAEETCYRVAIKCVYSRYIGEKESIVQRYCLFEETLGDREFVIYGAGKYGREAYRDLRDRGYLPKCFWVTNVKKTEEIDGIKILELPEKIDPLLPVIIAVSKEKQREMIKNLIDRGNRNYCVYPYYK